MLDLAQNVSSFPDFTVTMSYVLRRAYSTPLRCRRLEKPGSADPQQRCPTPGTFRSAPICLILTPPRGTRRPAFLVFRREINFAQFVSPNPLISA
jgi:hypothetical protein